jgi:hypothetical protein
MKIFYTCECCDEPIDTIEIARLDEAKFGFDCLSAEERQEMIKVDTATNSLYVQSLCDACIEALGLADEHQAVTVATNKNYLH